MSPVSQQRLLNRTINHTDTQPPGLGVVCAHMLLIRPDRMVLIDPCIIWSVSISAGCLSAETEQQV